MTVFRIALCVITCGVALLCALLARLADRLETRRRAAEERLLDLQIEHMQIMADIARDIEVVQRLRAGMVAGRERPRA